MRQDARAWLVGLVILSGFVYAKTALAQEDFCGYDLAGIAAGGAPLEMLSGFDDRRVLGSDAYPWRAIGALITPFGVCTATLVDVDLALTAAHCVADYLSRDMAPSDVRFIAGLQDGEAFATATVVRIVTATDQPIGATQPSEFRDDWAFIVLDSPIGAQTGTIPVFDLSTADLDALVDDGAAVSQAGYSVDIPGRLTAHIGCRVSAYHASGWLEHDCDTVPGDSGSPLMIARDGRPYIVAVASAVQCPVSGASTRNTAVDARAFYDAYRQLQRGERMAVHLTPPESQREQQSHSSGPRIIRLCDPGTC